MFGRRRRDGAGDRTVPADALPAVNTHVEVVRVGDDRPRPTRVEDVRGRELVVSRPSAEDGRPLVARPGTALDVYWTSELGAHELRVELSATVDGPVPAWVLVARAAAPVLQRREAFRLPVSLSVALRGEKDQPPLLAAARDVSETGMRVRVDASLDVGDRRRATFEVDEEGPLSLPVTVVRHVPAADGARELGMRFDDVSEEQATRLRRFIIQEQIRRRAVLGR